MRRYRTPIGDESLHGQYSTEDANELLGSNVPLCIPKHPDGWVGFDFDGTLSTYKHPTEPDGNPIAPMVERLKAYIARGVNVKIITARVSNSNAAEIDKSIKLINGFCQRNVGVELPVTCVKDYKMVRIYDDRAVSVKCNDGEILGYHRDD